MGRKKQLFIEKCVLKLSSGCEVVCKAYHSNPDDHNGESYIDYVSKGKVVLSEPYVEAFKRKSSLEGEAYKRAENLYNKLFCRIPFDSLRAADTDKNTVAFSVAQDVYKNRMDTQVPMLVSKKQAVFITHEVARLRAIEEKGLQVVRCFVSSEVPRNVDEIRNMFSDTALSTRLNYLEIGLIVSVVSARRQFKHKQQLAAGLGLDVSYMSRALTLIGLPFEVQDMFYKDALRKSLIDSFKNKKTSDTVLIRVARQAVSDLKKYSLATVKKSIAANFTLYNTPQDTTLNEYVVSPESDAVLTRCQLYAKKGIDVAEIKRLNRSESISSVEKGYAFNAYTAKNGNSNVSLARDLGIADGTVSYLTSLVKLPSYVQHLLISNVLDVKKGVALVHLSAVISDAAVINQAADFVIKEKYTVSETEKYVLDLLEEIEANRRIPLHSLCDTNSAEYEPSKPNTDAATISDDATLDDATPLNLKSVATILDVKVDEVNRYIAEGTLTSVTKEGSTQKYVTKDEVSRFMCNETQPELEVSNSVESVSREVVLSESDTVPKADDYNTLVQFSMLTCLQDEIVTDLAQRNIAGLQSILLKEDSSNKDDSVLSVLLTCKGRNNYIGFFNDTFCSTLVEDELYRRVPEAIQRQTLELYDDIYELFAKEVALDIVHKILLNKIKKGREVHTTNNRYKVQFQCLNEESSEPDGINYLYTSDSSFNRTLPFHFECKDDNGGKLIVTMYQGSVVNEHKLGK